MGCCLMFRTTLIFIENDVFQWLVPRPRPCFNIQIVGILNEKIGRVWLAKWMTSSHGGGERNRSSLFSDSAEGFGSRWNVHQYESFLTQS